MSTTYVNDLSGMDLDFWVACAEGIDAVRDGRRCLVDYHRNAAGVLAGEVYAPSLDPAVSEPLLAKYLVDTFQNGGRWAAELKGRDTPWGNGESPIEAALRAIVAARFGDAVEDGAAPAALPDVCFWLAFVAEVDGDGDDGRPRYLGHAIVEAPDMDSAVARARRSGWHAGADVRVYRVNDEDAHQIPDDLRNRPLSAAEAASLGWQDQ